MPNLENKIHMQIDTYKEYYCSCLIFLFLSWYLLPLAFFAFLDPIRKCSKKTLGVQEWEREGEQWETSKTKLAKPMHWSSEAFLSMRPLFSSNLIIFIQLPPHMKHVTFQLPFLLISIIFINKCSNNTILTFQSLGISQFSLVIIT